MNLWPNLNHRCPNVLICHLKFIPIDVTLNINEFYLEELIEKNSTEIKDFILNYENKVDGQTKFRLEQLLNILTIFEDNNEEIEFDWKNLYQTVIDEKIDKTPTGLRVKDMLDLRTEAHNESSYVLKQLNTHQSKSIVTRNIFLLKKRWIHF